MLFKLGFKAEILN